MKHFRISTGLFLAFLLFSLYGNSQNNMSLGPTVGIGNSWISGNEKKHQPYGNVGITFTYSPIEHLGLGADLLYSIEGGKYQTGSNNIITKADYIRIPM